MKGIYNMSDNPVFINIESAGVDIVSGTFNVQPFTADLTLPTNILLSGETTASPASQNYYEMTAVSGGMTESYRLLKKKTGELVLQRQYVTRYLSGRESYTWHDMPTIEEE